MRSVFAAPMRSLLAALFSMGFAASMLATCSKDTGDDDEDWAEDDEYGWSIDELEWDESDRSIDEDGDEHWREQARVDLLGIDHEIEILEEIDDDGVQILSVEDFTEPNFRQFTFDPAMSSLTMEDDEEGLITIVRNPDKSYTVDGAPIATGKAAVAAIKDNPVYRDASKWGIVVAFAVCEACVERDATRTPINCNGGSSVPAAPQLSELYAYNVFQDLLECALCDVIDKSPCAACP